MAVNDSIHYQVPDSLRDALLPYAGKEVDFGCETGIYRSVLFHGTDKRLFYVTP